MSGYMEVTNAQKGRDEKCPVTALFSLIGGKWKPIILYCLRNETRRFGEIAVRIPALSRKVLTDQLKELERDGLITREAFKEIPPRVEYALTPLGESLAPVFEAMESWGNRYLIEK